MAVPGVIRRVAGSPPFERFIDLLERLVPSRTDSLAVLTFHRVTADGPAVVPGILSATPAGFSALLDQVARRHSIVGIEDVLRRARGGRALPRRALMLTVDDAYTDFGEHAWPALRMRGLPVVLFVPTGYPDAPERAFWWERLHAAIGSSGRAAIEGPDGPLPVGTVAERQAAYRRLRTWLKALPHEDMLLRVDDMIGALGAAGEAEATPDGRVLSWDELRRLRAEGVALAPHTRTHPLLSRVSRESCDAEIAGSREDLARMTGSELPVFAYPSGATSPDAANAVRNAGIEVAFTTQRGVNDLRSADWLALRRINVSVRTPATLVRVQTLR
jgi:peptidoglycan/xylan/chitin deacetylase (PgdA/CDA1 family)